MRKNRRTLAERVITAAERTLAAQKYVSSIDVLLGIGWLDPTTLKHWRQGQVDYLERVVQTNLPRISEAMRLFQSWAKDKGLLPSETWPAARSARPCGSAAAALPPSKGCIGPTGSRPSCPSGSANAWPRWRAGHPSWS